MKHYYRDIVVLAFGLLNLIPWFGIGFVVLQMLLEVAHEPAAVFETLALLPLLLTAAFVIFKFFLLLNPVNQFILVSPTSSIIISNPRDLRTISILGSLLFLSAIINLLLFMVLGAVSVFVSWALSGLKISRYLELSPILFVGVISCFLYIMLIKTSVRLTNRWGRK